MVFNVWIQKFPLWIKRCRGISLVFLLVNFSIIINFACLLKLWFFSQKYLHATMVLGWGFVTSFPWLFSLTLKRISVFLTYCFLHNVHFIKYMTYAQEQLTSRKILCFLSLLALESWCCFRVLLVIFFTMLFSILLLPMSSIRFFLLLKAVTSSLWHFFFRDSLTDYIFQIFRIILLMFDKNQLYAITKGMLVFIGLSFLLLFIY